MPHRLTMKNVASAIASTNHFGHKRVPPTMHANFKHDNRQHTAKLSHHAVEDGVYEAESSDMSGHRTAKKYNGNTTVRWDPKTDFVEETSGYTEQSGAFMGGSKHAKAGKKSDYAQASGKTNNSNPNPHPIAFKKKSVRFK